jgi:hypothetical protein
VFLTNFNKLSTEIKPSALWSIYSMLKSIKNMKYNINVGTYLKLQVFFKEKIEWIKNKNSKVLTLTVNVYFWIHINKYYFSFNINEIYENYRIKYKIIYISKKNGTKN